MPSSDTHEDQRGARLLPLLFWAGVGLAPLAALLLLLGSGTTPMRAAIGVITLSVILIGLSITLRRDTDTLRIELEDMTLDEIDAVRADVRDDIATAAHATHRAFGEKFQYLVEQLEATRGELDATRAQLEMVRAETARHLTAGPVSGGPHRTSAPSPAAQHQQPAGPGRPGMQGVPGVPGGVVRHTETVQVTTRHTVVDPHGEEAQRGTVYGGGGFERGAPRKDADFTPRVEVQRPRADRDREESWTEQRLREQLERRRDAAEPVSADRWQAGDGWSERGASVEPDRWSDRGAGRGADRHAERGVEDDRRSDRDDDDRRPGMRSGDRWASVRSDDRGRELRMGERRAAMHSDESGTELRIEDRWAAVRREDARGGFSWADDDRVVDDQRSGFQWRDAGRGSREPERPAITGSDRAERWSEYDDDRERDRRYR
jgi:hypothetical protein